MLMSMKDPNYRLKTLGTKEQGTKFLYLQEKTFHLLGINPTKTTVISSFF